jgi:hypothetical protein
MSRRLLFIFLFLLYVGVTPGAPQKNIHPENQDNCRCGPRETCWPSDEDWKAFNETIQGNLLQIRPVGYVCHGESFEKKACDEVRSRANDSIWRGSEPGGLFGSIPGIKVNEFQGRCNTPTGKVGRNMVSIAMLMTTTTTTPESPRVDRAASHFIRPWSIVPNRFRQQYGLRGTDDCVLSSRIPVMI